MTVFFVPIPLKLKERRYWHRKIWELNAGLMGLGLSYVLALLLTQMVKNLFGKPRPDLLSRCAPDLSRLSDFVVEGYATDIAATWSVVSVGICTNTDASVLNDGFRSFFSGHASSSFSGLLYLSLWLATKLNVTLPYVQPFTAHDLAVAAARTEDRHDEEEGLALSNLDEDPTHSLVDLNPVELYRQSGAAVPIYGIVIAILPTLLAIWIAATRYQDYKHHGIDIFTGALVGSLLAAASFRSYHASLARGTAWTWAPRAADHAFAVTTSRGGKVGPARRRGAPATVAVAEASGSAAGGSNGVHRDQRKELLRPSSSGAGAADEEQGYGSRRMDV